MNIKSLLLGSAAAIVAVSGARAADVIVPVAPEPAEYVRVCDVYGSGFYYIPGTETCLSVSGYVRFKYSVNGDVEDGVLGTQFVTNSEGDDYTAFSSVRARLNFDAREETELGTLRGYIRLQGTNSGDGDPDTLVDLAYIQLGGLTMGYLDSLWAEGDGLLTDTDLSVGDLTVNRVSYTYAANGFSAAVSLEDDATGDFAPDVVGKLAYSGGWGSVYLAGSYDERQAGGELPIVAFSQSGVVNVVGGAPVPAVVTTRTVGVPVDDDGSFAIKGGLSLKDLVMADSELKVEGSYAFDPSSYSTIGLFNVTTQSGLGLTTTLPVEWQVGAGYVQSFGKLGIGFSGAYGETFDLYRFNAAGTTTGVIGDADYYKLVGNVGYEITNNFDVLAELSYTNLDFGGNPGLGFADRDLEQTAGFLQFIRSF